MSGPVSQGEEVDVRDADCAAGVEVHPGRESTVGEIPVRRVLPLRGRRTVGPWCFADHMGPVAVTEDHGIDVGPHPHIGLQTATWLVRGEALHRDSLGTEQLLRPGQLNLMTAGRGVSHAEEATGAYRGELAGIQLWIAQPEATRHGEPAFEHHAELPTVTLGSATATVFVGSLAGVESPARRDTDHLGAELRLGRGRAALPLDPAHEHALVVLEGALDVDGAHLEPGRLATAGRGRHELVLDAPADAVAVLLGGVPLPDELVMWWNFVGRSRDEVARAGADWNGPDAAARFGSVASGLARIDAPRPHWLPAP
jgi:redox-sensitive bicupin YhaK (pirin superfamily)